MRQSIEITIEFTPRENFGQRLDPRVHLQFRVHEHDHRHEIASCERVVDFEPLFPQKLVRGLAFQKIFGEQVAVIDRPPSPPLLNPIASVKFELARPILDLDQVNPSRTADDQVDLAAAILPSRRDSAAREDLGSLELDRPSNLRAQVDFRVSSRGDVESFLRFARLANRRPKFVTPDDPHSSLPFIHQPSSVDQATANRARLHEMKYAGPWRGPLQRSQAAWHGLSPFTDECQARTETAQTSIRDSATSMVTQAKPGILHQLSVEAVLWFLSREVNLSCNTRTNGRDGAIRIRPFNQPIDGKALFRYLWSRIDSLIVGLAIGLRLIEYARNRSLWLDEGSLLRNLTNTPILPIWRPLRNAQLAPAGFLSLERLIAQTLGHSNYALRLVPLISGIVAVLIFQRIAKNLLRPRAVTTALALFALSYDPIYYSVELKQYSSDLAISLGCFWTALLAAEGLNPRRTISLALLALLAPWFSHPSVFTITGVGLGLLVFKAVDRRWNELITIVAIGSLGAISFAGSYLVTAQLLANPGGMSHFWSITFLRFPPRNLVEARQLGGQLVDFLTNPLDLISPLCPWLSVGVVMAGLIGGVWVIFRERSRGLILAVLPVLVTALVSSAGRYPFHGRLVLFLVPMIDVVLVAGLESLGRRFEMGRWPVSKTLLILVLLHPLLNSAYHFVEKVPRDFSPLGDLHASPFPKSQR